MSSLPSGEQVHRASQILYRCLEEVGSTRAVLYLPVEGVFERVAHYGWPRHSAPPQTLETGQLLLETLESGPRVDNSGSDPLLAPLKEGSAQARFLLAPVPLAPGPEALLIQRDRGQGSPYLESRDIPPTQTICLELSEALDPNPRPPAREPVPVQEAIPVEAPHSEVLVSSLDLSEVVTQGPQKGLLAGTFLPEQRTFFWELAEVLFQVLPLAAAALWMEDPMEGRPILVYSRRSLSPDHRREIQGIISGQRPEFAPSAFRVMARTGSPGREPLDTPLGTHLPLLLEEEAGYQDLLLLCRADRKPFSESELQFTRHIARLAAHHLQEARLHERYHRAFLSVSRHLLGEAPGLRTHSLNTARLARNLAVRIGLPTATVEAVSIAAILHDVGSLLLDPDLHSRGRLRPEDLDRIRAHPVLASTFLKDFQFPFDVPSIIRHHHERWDGTGYPDGLSGEDIPMGSRIIAIIETFEVMTGGSGYRPPVQRSEALEEIRRTAGTQFDPALALEFLAMMEPGGR
nr:HD domain-containing phosphohydrolase [uncultured Holophaga sp.]